MVLLVIQYQLEIQRPIQDDRKRRNSVTTTLKPSRSTHDKMAHNTVFTQWLATELFESAKVLIDGFFSLLDDQNASGSDSLADETFTPDGTLTAAAGKASASACKVIDDRNHSPSTLLRLIITVFSIILMTSCPSSSLTICILLVLFSHS